MNLDNLPKEIIIISPHADDELIGNYEILMKKDSKIKIIYDASITEERSKETQKITDVFSNVTHLFTLTVYGFTKMFYCSHSSLYLFPDPINEIHPLHRQWGSFGESLLRNGWPVCFYSTNMNVPWLREVQNPGNKEDILNHIYPSQKSLWEYEKKYILFEGHYKWIV